MAAASATCVTMELPGVPSASDPRGVTMPLNPDRVESLLRELNLLDKWTHIVEGLRSGFDTDVSTDTAKTILFHNHASADLVRMCTSIL